jgi:hypothetical protein
VLLAIPPGPALDPLRARYQSAPRGSALRLDALAVFAERGEYPPGCDVAESVEMSLREIGMAERSGRSTLLAVQRIRELGKAARDPLHLEARGDGPSSGTARTVLRAVFGESVPPPGVRP